MEVEIEDVNDWIEKFEQNENKEIKTSKKICNVIEISDVEYHQSILGGKFKIKILNVNSDELQIWKGNPYARTLYKEKLKQIKSHKQELGLRKTYVECDRLGIVHDNYTRKKT